MTFLEQAPLREVVLVLKSQIRTRVQGNINVFTRDQWNAIADRFVERELNYVVDAGTRSRINSVFNFVIRFVHESYHNHERHKGNI